MNFLVKAGAPETRLRTISYGSDRPVCAERTEACAATNRRVHFLVKPQQRSDRRRKSDGNFEIVGHYDDLPGLENECIFAMVTRPTVRRTSGTVFVQSAPTAFL